MSKCEQHEWFIVDGLYALTKVEKKGGKVNFFPSEGVPVQVHVCKKCAELKLISAKVLELI